MKNIQILVIVLFSIGVSAQNITEINSDLKLSDSLTYETEVRVYQGGGITNYSSLFRMFKDNSEKWRAEFYEHYAKVEGQAELRTEKRSLKSENDMEFVFQNFIRSHILDLPNLNQIQWKLVTRGSVKKVKRVSQGKEIEEYELMDKQIGILDGEGYIIQVKGWNRTNEFEYSNPDAYLKHYPEIDELIYMCEILNTIRTEFGIWEK
ncbi:MAG TPA: hypothetical protein PKW08_13285 [Flavobacteriaceae bacterium]|nr:hypothetical protein [Flavobacteriaceae bacterium]MCB9213734.1 hypothetical protein [Alteromonas sp.]HPF12536.1 hypothetical protein [Flavobacteriaceae bacterium]HQU22555.1 hypothetical protein [Flavobacteriaceae bacterium]HQU66357.1 hypothetical protein [Flavobacteriaceae bacterium]